MFEHVGMVAGMKGVAVTEHLAVLPVHEKTGILCVFRLPEKLLLC